VWSPQRNERCTSPPLVRMGDFLIRIPRVSVAVSEAELIELLVENGQHVEEGTPIYVIATEKAEQEIEAGASGTVQWTGEVGTVYDIGVDIGVITS
jgi:pyruvate/2-oxoglutarate dehydrogenase complex dihydrolipoamide acyltransferase (E2) component